MGHSDRAMTDYKDCQLYTSPQLCLRLSSTPSQKSITKRAAVNATNKLQKLTCQKNLSPALQLFSRATPIINLIQQMRCTHFKELFHKHLVWMHFLPWKPSELSMESIENKLWHFGSCATFTVMH